MADIVIAEADLEPNPVETEGSYTISMRAVNKVHGILTSSGKLIMSTGDKAIEVTENG